MLFCMRMWLPGAYNAAVSANFESDDASTQYCLRNPVAALSANVALVAANNAALSANFKLDDATMLYYRAG